MTLLSSIRRVLSNSKRHNAAREAKRQQTLREATRRRMFEALENREMLDAAGFNVLPEVITIARPDSYHYAIEGTDCGILDNSTIEGLSASLLNDTQVAFTVKKTSATNGAVSTLGEVVIQLFGQDAPASSQHLLDVINSGYYEGKSIHRIIAGFMFQGGSLDGAGRGGPGTPIADEYSPLLTFSRAGTVAYANSGSNTSDAQFFVTFGDYGGGNNSYNIFGYVVDGYDVVAELEAAEVVNNGSGEVSKPVDSFTITGFRVLDNTDKTHSVLRLVSEAEAQGKTTLSYMSPELDEERSTTVYVGSEGLHEYIQDVLSKPVSETIPDEDGTDIEITYNSFEGVAGDILYGVLPSGFADNPVTYSITLNDGADGVTVTPLNESSSIFSIATTASEPQKATLTIKAESVYTAGYQKVGAQTVRLTDKLTTTVTQDVLVNPVAPTEVTFASEEAFQASGEWIVQSDFVDSQVKMKITTPVSDGVDNNPQPYLVAIDGKSASYTVDPQTGGAGETASTRTITFNFTEPLSDGAHTVSVQRHMPLPDGTFLDGASTTLDFTVETSEITLDESGEASAALLALQEGVSGSQQLKTNRVDSEGKQRAGVKYELVADDANPSYISVSATGLVTWTNPTAGQATIKIKATDEGGKSTTKDFTVFVEGKPVFSTSSPLASAENGAVYTAQIKATDPNGSDTPIKYELVGDVPEGMTIVQTDGEDAVAGTLKWDLEANPIEFDSNALSRDFTIKVKATKPKDYAPGDDEPNYENGLSVEKEFVIKVDNPDADVTKSISPVFDEIETPTVKTGGSLENVAIFADPPETVSGLEGYSPNDYEVVVELVESESPAGMKYTAITGALTWNVPDDYPLEGESTEVTAKLIAKTYKKNDVGGVVYGESEKTVTIKVEQGITFTDWNDWVSKWLDNPSMRDSLANQMASRVKEDPTQLPAALTAVEQARYSAHLQNLASYVATYVENIDKRDRDLSSAQTPEKFFEIRDAFEADPANKIDMETGMSVEATAADKAIDESCDATLAKLKSEAGATDAQVEKAAKGIKKTSIGNSKYSIANKATGVKVGASISDILKIWRNADSRETIYRQIYAERNFAESLETESGSGQNNAGNQTSGDQTSGNQTSGDQTSGSQTSGDQTSGGSTTEGSNAVLDQTAPESFDEATPSAQRAALSAYFAVAQQDDENDDIFFGYTN
ncbi:MAG: peptidylprolyl isomerase [Thermoguttaceae bacterium]|nr:peptidylprolyl isomerase [Thermoguttaceae bacterium]